MATEPRHDEVTGEQTTGHEWDGIEELNTPMPRWWLWVFYATIVFGIGYAVLMPAVPLLDRATPGLLGYSDREDVAETLETMRADRAVMADRLADASLSDIQADDELYRFAMAAGQSSFGDNCATCHGVGGQGFPGYPNLNDDVWIWGGTFSDIRQTIEYGIRSGHENERFNVMEAYGRNEFLSDEDFDAVVQYVRLISGQEADDALVDQGAVVFADNCASCHGAKGEGDRLQGAPNLTDQEWLYGGSVEDIVETIYGGRAGVMPNWDGRLSPEMITALAVYVHALGGGEIESDTPSVVPAAEPDLGAGPDLD